MYMKVSKYGVVDVKAKSYGLHDLQENCGNEFYQSDPWFHV